MPTLETTTTPESGLDYYRESLRGKTFFVAVLLLALLLLTFAALIVGAAHIGVQDLAAIVTGRLEDPVTASRAHILLAIRLPRVVLGIVAGMGLAISGAVMQAVLRNPMASSYTLGVSSAAGFGATLAIGLGWGVWGGKYLLVTNAFAFGMVSMGLVYGIARIKGAGPGTLILAGIAVSYLFAALVAIVKYVVNHDVLAGIVYWLMGGLNLAAWEGIAILLPLVTVPALLLIFKYSWDLNAMSSGDEVASSLGVNPEHTRIVVLTLATLITSAVVAFTGIIGFVCLVGPHMARMMIGSDHRFLLPFSCLTGAVLLLAADTLARTVIQPTELPVGVVTSLLGVPFFLHLLIRSRRTWK
jgi:iron complex transport system permease protein